MLFMKPADGFTLCKGSGREANEEEGCEYEIFHENGFRYDDKR